VKKLQVVHIIILSLVSILTFSCAPSAIKSLESDRKEVVDFAEELLDSPYQYSGSSPNGFDCSGFTLYVYENSARILLDRTAKAQSRMGKSIKKEDANPGDLIFFRKSGKIFHVAIIVKVSDKAIWVIHSTTSKGVIRENVLNSPYWQNKIAFCRSLF